jgi:hypothetical protein
MYLNGKLHFCTFNAVMVGPVAQSVLRLATGWTVRCSNPGGGRDFSHMSRQTLGPTHPPVNGYRVFPGVKYGRGVTLTPHPLLVLRCKNRVQLYLYSPYGTSWPIQMVKPT